MKLSWKLLPVAALFALGVFMVSLPSGIKQASADAVFVSAQPQVSGSTYTVTAQYTNNPAAGTGTLFASGFGTFTAATATVNGTGAVNNPSGIGSNTLTLAGIQGGTGASTVTVTATFTCNGAGSVLFTLIHTTQVNSQATPVTCGGGSGSGTLSITASPSLITQGAQGTYSANVVSTQPNQVITITSTPAYVNIGQPNITLNGFGQTETIIGQNTTVLTVYTGQAGTRILTGNFTCIQQGSFTLTISLSAAAGVAGTTANSTTIVCGTGLTPTAGPASNVTVAASPTSVSCKGTAFVTVTVRNAAGGYVADGTSVTLTASTGTLSPTTATTLGGGVLAVYTAPENQGGTATITASASGTAQGTATINVTCQTSTPTPAVPPTIFVPPTVVNPGPISPPNTGDAGLVGGNTWTYAGIVMMIASVVAGAAVVRSRA